MTKDEIILAQQARIERLCEALDLWIGIASNCSIESGCCHCGDSMHNHASPLTCGHSPVDMADTAVYHAIEKSNEALSTHDDLSALRAHDAATWREAMQIAEDSRDKATMSKYSSVPECRAARDMAECLSKAYCHKADAIEK